MSGVGEKQWDFQAHGFWGEDAGTEQGRYQSEEEGREGKDKEKEEGLSKTTTDEEMSDARFVPLFSPMA
ncbi:hypothetical protein B0T20DRAFT_347505 [Sordaria brevicollis]|uniref:Uncharacterized protein n=1 Tax=Sordaria brevicollis TaxID=83679 RepID=A0AAE0PJN4_SORBR|nr:hypothetical protein B0T20DRAFT_347505 [Sordaria brevicollis]